MSSRSRRSLGRPDFARRVTSRRRSGVSSASRPQRTAAPDRRGRLSGHPRLGPRRPDGPETRGQCPPRRRRCRARWPPCRSPKRSALAVDADRHNDRQFHHEREQSGDHHRPSQSPARLAEGAEAERDHRPIYAAEGWDEPPPTGCCRLAIVRAMLLGSFGLLWIVNFKVAALDQLICSGSRMASGYPKPQLARTVGTADLVMAGTVLEALRWPEASMDTVMRFSTSAPWSLLIIRLFLGQRYAGVRLVDRGDRDRRHPTGPFPAPRPGPRGSSRPFVRNSRTHARPSTEPTVYDWRSHCSLRRAC